MDLYCSKCGEPWEMDSLHDLVAEGDFPSFTAAARAFRRDGCIVFGCRHNVEPSLSADALAMVEAVYDLSGDDVDGAASDLSDFLS